MTVTTQIRKGVMNMELTYRMEGNFLLPNLSVPTLPALGRFGNRRREYLRNHRKPLYTSLLLTDKLNSHLEEIDRQAERMMETLTLQMAKTEGLTEELKAHNQMEWVQRMNSIRHCAEETVNAELIYR